MIALKNEQVDLGFRVEKMQKYSKGIYLMCYGHKPTKGSHCPKYRLGTEVKTSSALTLLSAIKIEQKRKQKSS